MKKIKVLFICMVIIVVLFAGLWAVRSYNARRFNVEKETRFMMDTYVTIYAIGPREISSKAIEAALNRMQEIAIKFDSLNQKSAIYAFNHQGTPISDPEIVGLIQLGLQISKESNGAFDMTVEPFLELWGFYNKNFRIPQEQEIKDCLKNVGYQHLSLDSGKLKKDNTGVRIDLGGIAKGYALAEAVKVLKNTGVNSALIDAGGDVYALGKKSRKLWRVGIKDPREDGILGYVEVEDLAVIGSGDYERFFIKDGRRYHHIFNSKTGYPAEGVASVTLIYSDPILAQGWAKIPFILGPEKGLELLSRKLPGVEAIIITTSGKRFYSSGLERMLNVVSDNH